MWETVLKILWSLLALFGLSELLHEIRLCFAASPECLKPFLVLFLKEKTAEEQLRFAVLQRKWYGDGYAEKIFAVCDGLTEETRETCRQICTENRLILCSTEQLRQKIQDA